MALSIMAFHNDHPLLVLFEETPILEVTERMGNGPGFNEQVEEVTH